jgi:hypothetical protein
MNIRSRAIAGALGLAAGIGSSAPHLFGAPGFTAQHKSSWTPTITAITSPALAKAGEPQLTASTRGVLLSWIEHASSTTTLRFAERTQTGWTEPRTVASGQDWSVNAIDVPSVLRLSNGELVAQWLQRSGTGMHSNDVRLSYSRDDGRTWAPPFTPYQDEAQRERLFASLFEMPGGALGLIWLDGGTMLAATSDPRKAAPDHAHGGDPSRQHGGGPQGRQAHEGHGGTSGAGVGDMSLRFASFDGAWKQSDSMLIATRVCECCSTAAAVTFEGVLAAYRNRSDDDPSTASGSPRAESNGEIRDIYVSRLTQGRWSKPVVVYADNWQIPACPINGPALSAIGRNVAIAWYTVKQDQGHAYVAFSSDAGGHFAGPIRLDDNASLGRADVELLPVELLPDGSALATWIEFADGRSQFRARRVTRDGARSAAVTIAGLAGGRAGGAPRVARHGDELVFAWVEASGDTSQVRTAVARVPRVTP